MNEKNRQKPPKTFVCNSCDFKCSKQSEFNKHILTRKHKNRTELNILEQEKLQKTPLHSCNICGKEYTARNSLWYHKKTCQQHNENSIVLHNEATNTSTNQVTLLTSLVMEVVKSNRELQKQSAEVQKQFLDVCKNLQPSLNNNCNNTNNNTFNMQVFLNEECKDAINLSDFVNSFEVQLEDLESVGQLGYTAGISNMIIKELKLLDVYKRPIHCSDARREIFYVKENNIWERETPDNSTVKKAIQGVTRKNMIKLNDWREKYPECMDSESVYNDLYLKLIQEACASSTNNDNKIFKNIMKEVLIKK